MKNKIIIGILTAIIVGLTSLLIMTPSTKAIENDSLVLVYDNTVNKIDELEDQQAINLQDNKLYYCEIILDGDKYGTTFTGGNEYKATIVYIINGKDSYLCIEKDRSEDNFVISHLQFFPFYKIQVKIYEI